MKFEDLFKPYTPETHGDLIVYLRTHDGLRADNLFRGPRDFFVIKDLGLITPLVSSLRVDRSPIPDLGYLINEDFLLEGSSDDSYNMSMVSAKRGIYRPELILQDVNWSISNLDYGKLSESHK